MDKRGAITFLDYKVNKVEFKNNDVYDGEAHRTVMSLMMVRR